MTDNWDDSDDDWDADDSELDARLGLNKKEEQQAAAHFDDEEDLAVKEKELSEKLSQVELKKKGNALAEKKAAEKARKEEEELARKAMELEAEMEENMTDEERRALEKRRVEEADNELTDDLFGGVDDGPRGAGTVAATGGGGGGGGVGTAMNAGDTVKMKDLKDHLKHARKVGQCIKAHGKTHLATAFLKEAIQECKDVLDDNAISELIKTCNVIKNEKVAAAKRKVKGQATKGAKRDKVAEQKAKKLQVELYGDSNQYDKYDEYGESYEDDFF